MQKIKCYKDGTPTCGKKGKMVFRKMGGRMGKTSTP